jgi:hypothetical protein
VEHLTETSSPPAPAADYLTTGAAAELAGVSKATVCKWCRTVDGLAIRPGVQWLIRPGPLAAFLRPGAGGGHAEG